MPLVKIFFGLFVTLFVDLWWAVFGKKRALGVVQACAKELKLAPGGFSERWEEWKIIDCYEGPVEGLSTSIGLAVRYEEVGELKIKVAAAFIKTKTPTSIAFRYEIGRMGSSVKKNFLFPDPAFSGKTTINSDNGAMLVTLLENGGLRGLILNFLSHGKEAALDECGGWLEVRGLRSLSGAELSAHVRRAARVTRALYDRAVAAGLVHRSKAA